MQIRHVIQNKTHTNPNINTKNSSLDFVINLLNLLVFERISRLFSWNCIVFLKNLIGSNLIMTQTSEHCSNSRGFLLCSDYCYFVFNCFVQFHKQTNKQANKQLKSHISTECSVFRQFYSRPCTPGGSGGTAAASWAPACKWGWDRWDAR